MRIISPQSATLTNIEVLTYLTQNPPRRPPNAPPGVNQKHWIPSPDLRDHNTVVKEIHNYATRLSPHLLRYPGCTVSEGEPNPEQEARRRRSEAAAQTQLDNALRDLITRLQPYGLTKGEVLMIVNLGVGVPPASAGASAEGEEEDQGENGAGDYEGEQMDVDGDGEGNGQGNGNGYLEGEGAQDHNGEAVGEGEGEGEEGEEGEAGDYGALALIDTVIEEREQRLSDENVLEILAIIRETLGAAAM